MAHSRSRLRNVEMSMDISGSKEDDKATRVASK